MICEKAHAKINWTLDVLARRPDGYHELDSIMQSVSLYDELHFEPNDSLSLNVFDAPVPSDADNLVLRAANALRAHCGLSCGARITLRKHIPVSAGLGGGSADAAAALRGLCRLWRVSVPEAELARLALSIGADVPFCLRGGLQRARGVGETLTPLSGGLPSSAALVLVKPCRGVSTRDVFGALDAMATPVCGRPDTPSAQDALADRDIARLAASLGNALQSVTLAMRPELGVAQRALVDSGALAAQMSGSGPTMFGLYVSPARAKAAFAALGKRWPQVFLCRPHPEAP